MTEQITIQHSLSRIVSSDSEPEELETAVVHSQVTLVPDTVSTPNEDNVVPEAKRVSVAWLCFDREKTYQKHGINCLEIRTLH